MWHPIGGLLHHILERCEKIWAANAGHPVPGKAAHMKPGVRQDRSEYIHRLHQQLRWIERSASAYDGGDLDEAIRMATHVRTLVYDKGGSSVSLLTHLGIKKTVRFPATATPKSPTSEMWAGITYIEIGAKFAHAVHLPN